MKLPSFALFFSLTLVTFAIATPALCQENNASKVLVERVGDTAFIQLHAPSFEALSPRQQALAYWLTQASIAIDPIIYDQLSPYGLQQKRLLEEILAHPKGIDPAALAKISEFAKLFWANRGNHNDMTSQKFLPAFTFEELEKAALIAQQNGAFQTAYADLPPLKNRPMSPMNWNHCALRSSILRFEPMTTAKSPRAARTSSSPVRTPSMPGISLADLKDFKESIR